MTDENQPSAPAQAATETPTDSQTATASIHAPSARDGSVPLTDSAPGEETSPPAEPDPLDAEIEALFTQIKSTIQDTLDDEKLSRTLHKRIKKIKNWDLLSEHAKLTCAHILATYILYKNSDVEKEIEELILKQTSEQEIFDAFVDSMHDRPYFQRQAFRKEFQENKLKRKDEEES